MVYSPFSTILNLFNKENKDLTLPLLDMKTVVQLYDEIKQESSLEIYFPEDLEVYREIVDKVKRGNVNNITRTSSYLEFFKKHSEIHWSFLAHMVSRNAGYHMTDIRNRLLTKLLNKGEQGAFFSFLERCNAAIFHDAYPQLLLYEKWKVTGRSSFHLLKKFHVSIFMRAIWDEYITTGNEQLLTLGLIMNEQHMIQRRILTHSSLDIGIEKWKFFLQDRLEFTSILFPYGKRSPYSLAGLSVSHFEQVQRRILLGKKLYSILFHRNVFPTALSFAIHHSHTGSRGDYWPHIYSKQDIKSRLYSPTLRSVWEDIPTIVNPSIDWFADQPVEVMSSLLTLEKPYHFSMTLKWKAMTSVLVNLKRE